MMVSLSVLTETKLPKYSPEVKYIREAPGQEPTWSNQYQDPACTKHSVGKAIVAVLNDHGLNCNQDKIIEALGDNARKYPWEFHQKVIKVLVTEKEGQNEPFEVQLYIQVKSGRAKVENFVWKQEKLEKTTANKKMVITWDLTTAESQKSERHCLYCEEVSPDEETFKCINSWGPINNPKPHVPSIRVCAVDYIIVHQI